VGTTAGSEFIAQSSWFVVQVQGVHGSQFTVDENDRQGNSFRERSTVNRQQSTLHHELREVKKGLTKGLALSTLGSNISLKT
jgi:hypothetical protein